MDSSGALTIAEQGVVLAQARTRAFDVFATENYVAPGLESISLGAIFFPLIA